MLTVSTNYSTAVSKTLTQPGFLVKVGWATPKYFSSRGTVVFNIPGDSLPSTFVSTPITVSAINTDVTAKSTGALTIGIDPTNPLQVTQYALSADYGFANTPIDIWLYDANTLYTLRWAGSVGLNSHIIRSPDSAANSITDDIDIRADVLANDWTSDGTFASKDETGAGQISFRFFHTSSGYLFFSTSSNGTATTFMTSTALHNFTDVTRHWVRVTRIALTGVVTFYTSTDGLTWTRLGDPLTGTTGAIFNSTSSMQIGSYQNSAGYFKGKIYRVQIYNGIEGTPYALFDGTSQCYISTANTGGAQITEDIEINVAAKIDNYTVGFQTLLAKWISAGVKRAYRFGVTSTSILLYISSDGSTESSVSQAITLTAGVLYYFKVTRIKSSGATNFYYSTDGVNFTQIGTTQTLSAGVSMYTGGADIYLGGYDSLGASGILKGKVYSAKILRGVDGQLMTDFDLTGVTNSPNTVLSANTASFWDLHGSAKIGGVLAVDFNPQDAVVGTSPFTSTTTGETWTITGGGGIAYQEESASNELNSSDAIKIFKGIGDSATLDALELKTTLIPVNLISSVSPRVRINPRNGFNYIQPRGTVVNWGTDRFTLE